jgi:hypothetical protein
MCSAAAAETETPKRPAGFSVRPSTAPLSRRRYIAKRDEDDEDERGGPNKWDPIAALHETPAAETSRIQLVEFKDDVRSKHWRAAAGSEAANHTLYIVNTDVEKPVFCAVVVPSNADIRLRQTFDSAPETQLAPVGNAESDAKKAHVNEPATASSGSPVAQGVSPVKPLIALDLMDINLTAAAAHSSEPLHQSAGQQFHIMVPVRPQATPIGSAQKKPLVSKRPLPVPSRPVSIKVDDRAELIKVPSNTKAHKVFMAFELEAPLDELMKGSFTARLQKQKDVPKSGLYAKLEKKLARRMNDTEAHMQQLAAEASKFQTDNQDGAETSRSVSSTNRGISPVRRQKSPSRGLTALRVATSAVIAVQRAGALRTQATPIRRASSPHNRTASADLQDASPAFFNPQDNENRTSLTVAGTDRTTEDRATLSTIPASILASFMDRRGSSAADPQVVLNRSAEREKQRGPSRYPISSLPRPPSAEKAEIARGRLDSAISVPESVTTHPPNPPAFAQRRRLSTEVQAGPSVDERDAVERQSDQRGAFRRGSTSEKQPQIPYRSSSPTHGIFGRAALVEDADSLVDFAATAPGPASTHLGNPRPQSNPVGVFRTPLFSPVTRHIKIPVGAVVDAAFRHAGVTEAGTTTSTRIHSAQQHARPTFSGSVDTGPSWGNPRDMLKMTVGNARQLSDTLRAGRPAREPERTVKFASTLPASEEEMLAATFHGSTLAGVSAAATAGDARFRSRSPAAHPSFRYASMYGWQRPSGDRPSSRSSHQPSFRPHKASPQPRTEIDYAYNVPTVTDFRFAAIYSNVKAEVLSIMKQQKAELKKRPTDIVDASGRARPPSPPPTFQPSRVTRPASASASSSKRQQILPKDGLQIMELFLQAGPSSPLRTSRRLKELSDLASETQQDLADRQAEAVETTLKNFPFPFNKQ